MTLRSAAAIANKQAATRQWRAANAERVRANHRDWSQRNREHINARMRAWRRAHPDLNRTNIRSSMFRLTPGQYEAMLEAQGGGCAICGSPPPTDGRALAVDHDHSCCPGRRSCGRCVRGLLCMHCNQGIGRLGDDPDRLRLAADYLERREYREAVA